MSWAPVQAVTLQHGIAAWSRAAFWLGDELATTPSGGDVLNLLAGAIVTYLAATLPAVPTGFWDRNPKPTPGRLRRLLARVNFPKLYPLPERLRKKDSVCDHLPKGILGHRRTKQTASA